MQANNTAAGLDLTAAMVASLGATVPGKKVLASPAPLADPSTSSGQAYRAGKLSRRELVRNAFVETASLLLAACALWVFILARLVGGHVTDFVQEQGGWLLALLSAIVVGSAAGLAVKKTLGRWVKG
jgi:hypothetical protein